MIYIVYFFDISPHKRSYNTFVLYLVIALITLQFNTRNNDSIIAKCIIIKPKDVKFKANSIKNFLELFLY